MLSYLFAASLMLGHQGQGPIILPTPWVFLRPVGTGVHPPASSTKEFVASPKLNVTYTVNFTDTGLDDADEDYGFYCCNDCFGERHDDHEDCNFSCDERDDPAYHADVVPADFEDSGALNQGSPGMKDIGFDFSLEPDAAPLFVSAIQRTVDDALNNSDTFVDVPCWNDYPCEHSFRPVVDELYSVDVTYVDHVGIMRGGQLVFDDDPPRTLHLGTASIPTGELADAEYTVDCMCDPHFFATSTEPVGYQEWRPTLLNAGALQANWTKTTDADMGLKWTLPTPSIDLKLSKALDLTDRYSTGLYLWSGSRWNVCGLQDQLKLGIKTDIPDMNHINVSVMNPYSFPITLAIPPGTLFKCNNHSAQNMVSTSGGWLKAGPYQWASTTLGVGQSQADAKGFFALDGACTQLHKPMPQSGLQYTIFPDTNYALCRLARSINQEHFKGPWDQVKVWILTDQPTLEEIRKAVVFKPNEDAYLRALMADESVAKADLLNPKYRRCFEPSLIVAKGAELKADEWLVRKFEMFGPTDLSAWVTAHLDQFHPEAGADDLQHCANVASALCESSSPDIEKAGLAFLSAVPSDQRSAFAKAGGLAGLSLLIEGSDPSLVGQGLSVAEAWVDPASRLGLLNLAPSMPPDLKSRAAALLQKIAA